MTFDYPAVRRDETIKETHYGVEVCDPYRWLEDPDSEETKQFVEAQNNVTMPFLHSCKDRDKVSTKLTQMWDYPKYSCPYRHGDKYFHYMNTGLQNQSVLYVQDSLESPARVFLDPNALSADGTIALSGKSFSDDEKIMAYTLSCSGSDWVTVHFKDVETGKDYSDKLERVKFTSMAWTHDNKGIFYGQYPEVEGKADGSETDKNQNNKLYYHRVGSPQSEDVMVVEFPEEPGFICDAEVSDCGRWLLVMPRKLCKDNLLYFADLSTLPNGIVGKLQLTQVVYKLEADYVYVTNDGPNFIFRTNKDAPNYRLITINFNNPDPSNWKTLLPQHPADVLDWASAVANDKLVLCYIHDVKSVLQVHSLKDGSFMKELPLPMGTITGYSGRRKYPDIFYQFTSFLSPGIIYRCDLSKTTFEPKIFREITLPGFDPSLFEQHQVFYTSKDRTKVPMFIIHKKGMKLDGQNGCLLYGYGGFNVSLQPVFSVTRLVFIKHLDGVVAIPNLRGGGEYGEKWHDAGRLLNKQNVFDDFQAAAEYLISEGYTNRKLLAIQGGSNGGLLVAACLNQRPDLFKAGIAQVGVLDMLRYHKFTIGAMWVSDYGNPDEEKHFKNVMKYSPLHNIRIPENQTF
ncbi:hypothetical protein AAG570_006431 [Ranatra chinensis]|uniref:Prolyl endopeptidase n=1 Tax=Ranatra chinensis TaxID=642074 RepID=A0ABD0Z6S7_9HEMI